MSDGLSFALPLFIMAIGGIYSEKSGIANLALEGFQGIGAFVGALAAVLLMKEFGATSQVPYYAAILFAMLGGMIYSMLHALLCIKLKANQVISGVVINILAVSFSAFLTKTVNHIAFQVTSDRLLLGISPKWTIPILSKIPVIGTFFRNRYPFELIIIVIAIVAWYVLYQTRYGLHLRACGDNPHAIDAAGLSVSKIRFFAVMVSGALSGLAGISFAYSVSASYSSGIYAGYGYLSIAAFIFGNWKIVPTLAACLIFGFSRSGGYKMIQMLELPGSYSDFIMILPYAFTLLLLVFFSKHHETPKALGESYDKEKR